MNCFVDMFHKLPQNKKHRTNHYVVSGFLLHFHLQFDTKLVQGECEIRRIPCACNTCTYKLGFPLIPKLSYDFKNQGISFHNILSNQIYWLN